jgi:cardiolipin synthase
LTEADILATGPFLMKGGVRGFEPVLEEILSGSVKEIQLLSYIFTPQAFHIINLLQNAAERGVTIIIIVNSINSQNQVVRKKLLSLGKRYPHVQVLDFSRPDGGQLHAKVIVVDRKIAVVGSANLSWGGMYGNYEVGILLRGEGAWRLALLIDSIKQMIAEP